ncbi:MAG: hypothetical protein Fur0022_01020 [Anaerolineales bacterium]
MNKTLRITFTILGIVGILVLLGIFFGRAGWNMAGPWTGSMMGGGMMNGMGQGMMPGHMPGIMGGGFTNGWGSLGWPGNWPGMILGWLVNLGLIIGAVFLVTWLVRGASASSRGSATAGQFPAPREVLQTRYARGEITREQYLEILGDLS